MNSVIKSLADGTLGVTEADIYTAPALTPAIVQSINFANKTTSTVVVYLYFRLSGGGTSTLIRRMEIPALGSAIEGAVSLGAGDKLRAYADSAAAVDYKLNGTEFPNV